MRAAAQVRQRLEYEERSFTLAVNQLLLDEWALSARYRLTDAALTDLWNASLMAPGAALASGWWQDGANPPRSIEDPARRVAFRLEGVHGDPAATGAGRSGQQLSARAVNIGIINVAFYAGYGSELAIISSPFSDFLATD